MKTERRLLNKYDEFLTILLAKGILSFKKKEEMDDVNRILKDIRILKRQFIKSRLSEEINNVQMKMKFKNHRR